MKRKEKKESSTGSSFLPLPNISARSWAVYDCKRKVLVAEKHESERREIASITKIMTAYTAISLISRFDINMDESKIETPFEASLIGGTTAELEEGDLLSVWDMLHAMLLPSGNDAAYSIAEYFGMLLLEIGLPPITKSYDPVTVFVAEMNKNAKELGLSCTHFANPHGLPNVANKSTALDICKLATACMDQPVFAEIVSKQKHSCLGYDIDSHRRLFTWINTNKLLANGFTGIKTGHTYTAGPCLVSSFVHDSNTYVIVLLSSKTGDHRWKEALTLKEFVIQKQEMDSTKDTMEIQSPVSKKKHSSNHQHKPVAAGK